MERNSNGTLKSNGVLAFEAFVQWLAWYPKEYKGAMEYASDYIDDENDMKEFSQLLFSLRDGCF